MNKQHPFIFTNHKRHPKYEEKNFGHLASEVIVVEQVPSNITVYILSRVYKRYLIVVVVTVIYPVCLKYIRFGSEHSKNKVQSLVNRRYMV